MPILSHDTLSVQSVLFVSNLVVSLVVGSTESISGSISNPTSSNQELVPLSTNTHPMVTRSKNGIFKPKTFAIQADYSCTEPLSYSIAAKFPHWVEATDSELTSLQ